MAPLVCSNNACGTYDHAGIKTICGKCYMESQKEHFQRLFKHEEGKCSKSMEILEDSVLDSEKENTTKSGKLHGGLILDSLKENSPKHEDEECAESEEIEDDILDNFNVCDAIAAITLKDS